MSEVNLPVSPVPQSDEIASSPDDMLDALAFAYDESHCNTEAYRSEGIKRRNTTRPRVTESDSEQCKMDGAPRHRRTLSQKLKALLNTIIF